MHWSVKLRPAVVLAPTALVALSILTVSVLYSQIPGVTVVAVGTEPRSLAINPTTNRAVVTNHNTNTVTVANLTNQTTTTVTVGSHPWGVAINTSTNKAYVANEGSDTVSVLNLATNTVTTTIPVGGNPKEIAVNSSTNVGIVANTKSDTVSILDLATNTVTKSLTVGVDPQGVVVNTSTNKAYVTNAGSDTVSVIDLATKTVTATLTVGAGPAGIDINTGTKRLAVANRLAGTVTILNTTTNAVVATVTVGAGPADVAINTTTNRAYVTNTYSDSVSVIDLATNAVIATYPVGANPDGIAVVSQYNVLLVVNAQGDTVSVIDLNNPPAGTSVPVGRDPEGVAIDVDTNTAVTANAKSNDLSVVDLSTATQLARIPVGQSPRDVAIHPTSHVLVAANFRANTVSIVDLPTRTVVATVTVGKGPRAVAIDPILNLAVVANERADTLSLIDLSTRALTATLPAGSHPTDVAVNPTTHVAVVANKKIDQVTLIDLVNRVTIGTVTVGKDPVSIAVNPVTNTAIVANEKAGTLSVINLSTNTVTATLTVLPMPTGVAINPSTNSAAVVGHETNTLKLVNLATNAVVGTFSAGKEPQQVAINPATNVAGITNEDPPALTILQLPNPVPVLTSLVPVAVSAGDASLTLTLNGTKFLKTSTVTFGPQTFPTRFVSNSQIQAAIPASAITTPGSVPVTVTNPAPGGGTSNSLTFTINSPPNPTPVISAITPTSATAGDPPLTLTVDGTNFITASSIVFSGQTLTTTFVSAQRVTASVPASAIGLAGSRSVTVITPAPGGGTSNAMTFTVNNPAPTTTSISPTAVVAGTGDTTITVNGTSLVGTSVVQFNGAPLATLVVSGAQLQATIPAARLTSAGVFAITVVTPAPGGGTSHGQPFTVTNPAPTLSALAPGAVPVGSAGIMLTLTGTNFVSTSAASVGGTSVPTTVINASQLTAQVPASWLTAAGSRLVTVTNPAPGGGTSNSLVFTVTNPVPTATGVSPAVLATGGGDATVTVTGTAFVPTSSVVFDGRPLATTVLDATHVSAVVPAAALTVSRTAQVTVVNPAPGGGASNAVPLIVNARPVAHGGRDRSVTVGKTATLDGRQSADPDGDRLTFAWSLVSIPPGSAAAVVNPTRVQPSLTPDVAGTYQVQLMVNDGKATSGPAVVLVTAVAGHAPPNAEPGAGQTTMVGRPVTLDGRKSSDPDDARLTYRWSVVSAPTGSTATITKSSDVLASLTPDMAGEYVVQLVVNDGVADSAPGRLTITVASPNAVPMAKAGRDLNVLTGSLVSLDGSGSRDPNGDPLTYAWTIVAAPTGSTAALSGAATPTPSFTPDVSGEYLVRLAVRDGVTDSAPDTILIRADAPNSGPNAVAGSDQLVYQTDTVTLDGTRSNDPNGDPLSYQWLIVSTPTASLAALSTATVAQPTFVADQDGLYVVRLTVSDGLTTSAADVVVVKTRPLVSLAVTPASPSIRQGQTQAFTATGTFEDQATRNLTTIVTWRSSNQAVATINASGVATGLVAGTTQITAAYAAITSPGQTVTVINPIPTITSVTPLSGPVGATVTLTGTNFDLIPANNQVRFNGTVAQVTTSTATTIQAVVPAGATTGPISVTTAGGTATSAQSFYVIRPPTITSFAPTSGPIGTAVTITGTNFNTVTPGDNQLRFAGTRAIISAVTATSITTTVPLGATTGPITLATSGGTVTSATPFTVTLSQDYSLTLTPSPAVVIQSDDVHVAVRAAGTNGFSGIVTLAVSGLPVDATARLSAPTIPAGGLVDLTVRAATTLPAGNYPYTLTGTSTIDGQTITRTASGVLTVQAAGVTTITGQVLNTLDEPLPGVIITMDGKTASTDAGGNFILPNVVVGNNRVAFVDGRPVVKGTEQYPIVEAMLNVRANIANRVPYIIWLPALSQHLTPVDPTRDTVVTNPDIPDMQVLLPKGTELITLEGTRVTAMSITQVPIDRAPMPLPLDWTVGSLFSIQPGGATANRPIPVIYPNILGNEPGTRVNLFFFDVEIGDWRVYGQGTVSQDGKRIIPDPGVGQPRTAWGGAAPPPPPPPPPPEDNTCKLRDPVDVSTGQFILDETDMALPGRIPIRIVRSYRSGLATIGTLSTAGIFGPGTTWNHGLALNPSGTQSVGFTSATGFFLFAQNPDGSFANSGFPFLRGDTVTTLPNGTRQLRKKDGMVYRFGADGRLTEQVDRNGNRLLYSRDGLGNLVKIAEPSGRGITLTYDSSNRITSITDPIGRAVTYGYNAAGQLETVTNPAGGVTRYTYGPANRILTITDPKGTVVVRNAYDVSGRVTQQEEVGGGVARYNYILSGTIVVETQSTDPLGNVSVHRMNSRGYCTATVDALGHQVRYERDFGANLLLSERDPLNRITRYTYDLAGNTTSVVDPAGNVTLTEYEPAFNNLVKVTDALGQITRFVYDERGNRIQTIDPLGHITRSVYDTQGQVVQTTDPLGSTTSFGYDPDGNLIVVTDPVGNQTRRVYDARSRLVEVTNGKGETTKFTYNALNRITAITDPAGATVPLAYDANQNLLTVTDQKNQTLTHAYDLRNRLITLTDPIARSETYQYDANDNEIKRTDRKLQVTSTTYDPLNRKSQETFADGSTVTYRYDAVGHLIELKDSLSGPMSYTYHTMGACAGCGAGSLDQLIEELTPQGTVRYTYDTLSRRTSLAINGQTPIGYTYDPHSLLLKVEQGAHVIQLGYDAANRRTSLTYPNGVTTSYRYDPAGQLLEIGATLGLTPLETLSYAYDRSGSRTMSGRQLGATRLPMEVTAAVDAANRLVTFNGDQLSYDANGNLTARSTATQITSYTWDARNRLVAISGPGLMANFAYDATGRRVAKTINGERTDYLYSGQSIVQEINGSAASVTYLIGDRLDEVFASITAAGTAYYQSDALGSVMALTDQQGGLVTTYSYEPFGRTAAAGAGSSNPFQYTGRENDGTGLYYYRARYYSSELQRFISEDPIRLGGRQLNFYAYVSNSPVNAIDPDGLAMVVQPYGSGIGACEYYQKLCDKTNKCGNRDQYACGAYKCCQEFGEGLVTNFIRQCLIDEDQDSCADKRSVGARQWCRRVAHYKCYGASLFGGSPFLYGNRPRSCDGIL